MFPRFGRPVAWLVLFLFLSPLAVRAGDPVIRVAVLRGADHCVLGVAGPYDLRRARDGERLDGGGRLRPALVQTAKGGLDIGGRLFASQPLLVQSRRDVPLRLNNRHYRGQLLIVPAPDGTFTVVNQVPLEEYVRGVLYHEVSDTWPMEALKAQAVATRTYALYAAGTRAARDYDVTDDVASQVYGGKSAERYRTNLAVRATQGEVLTWQGNILPAFFHSNSGGVTESAAELWGLDIPPLRGGIASPYSIDAPHFNWKVNLRLKNIQDKLLAAGIDTGEIGNIAVSERTPNRRVRRLTITARDGKETQVEGKKFREIIGPNILRSNIFRIVMAGYYVNFIGNGWGHGVGMCQWGAYNMAKARLAYRAILAFYYPGARLQRGTFPVAVN